MIPESVIEEIKQRINIAELVGEYVQLTLKGDRYWGLSPFKNEKTPSFTVNPEKQMYYCFSTNTGGNIFSFLMEMEGLSFPEAVEFLGKRVGIDVHSAQSGSSDEFKERAALEELYEKIMESFMFLLQKKDIGTQALGYIRDRGFSGETVNKFKLGYSHPDPYWLHGFLQKKGYSERFLAKSGLFSKNNSRWSLFSHRLMFPIFKHRGAPVAFGARLLEGEGPKYINSPDTGIFQKRFNLYGLQLAKEGMKNSRSFILCEGYFDVLAFHQAGLVNAVAPLGTAFTEQQAKLLSRYARNGILVFDGDDAGIRASQKAALVMEKAGLTCDILSLKEGEDPADILQKNGSQELKNLVDSSTSALEYLISKAASESDSHSPGGKQRIFEQLFPYIRSIDSPVKREESLREIADRLFVSQRSVFEAYERFGSQEPGRRFAPRTVDSDQNPEEINDEEGLRHGASSAIRPLEPNVELHLMVAAVVYPEFFEHIRMQLQADQFEYWAARDIFIVLEEQFRSGEMVFSKILDNLTDKGIKDYIIKKATADEYGLELNVFFQTMILRVRSSILERQRAKIEAQMKLKERSGDAAGMRELQEEKHYLDSTLKELKESVHDRAAE